MDLTREELDGRGAGQDPERSFKEIFPTKCVAVMIIYQLLHI